MSIADLNHKITQHRLKGINLIRDSRELLARSKDKSLSTDERQNLIRRARIADDKASDEFIKAREYQIEVEDIEHKQNNQ